MDRGSSDYPEKIRLTHDGEVAIISHDDNGILIDTKSSKLRKLIEQRIPFAVEYHEPTEVVAGIIDYVEFGEYDVLYYKDDPLKFWVIWAGQYLIPPFTRKEMELINVKSYDW